MNLNSTTIVTKETSQRDTECDIQTTGMDTLVYSCQLFCEISGEKDMGKIIYFIKALIILHVFALDIFNP